MTDVLDGYFARKWGEQSAFGRMLDPIADKLLVASCLLMLAADGTIRGWSLWAAIVILCREILVSGLREYLAELRVSVPVTQLAKWKTTLQLVAVGFLHCRQGRRCGRAGGDADGAHAALALGVADAVHRLGLFPRRRAASDRGLIPLASAAGWSGRTPARMRAPAVDAVASKSGMLHNSASSRGDACLAARGARWKGKA